MKHRFPIIFAVMTIMAGCSKEKCDTRAYHTLEVSCADETRVSLGEKNGDRYPLLWSVGDVISVGQNQSLPLEKADIPSESGGARAVFRFEEVIEPGILRYPSAASAPSTFSFPARQNYPASIPLWGKVTDDASAIRMTQSCAIFRLTISGEDTISEIRFENLGSEPLSGNFSINPSTGALTPLSSVSTAFSTTFSPALNLPAVVNIPILCGDYAKGFRVCIVNTDGKTMQMTAFKNGRTISPQNLFEASVAFRTEVGEIPVSLPDLPIEGIEFDTPPIEPLTVGSFNIWQAQSRSSYITSNKLTTYRHWQYSAQAVAKAIVALKADIIGLTELNDSSIKAHKKLGKTLKQLVEAEGATSYSWHIENPNNPAGTYTFANGFLYKKSRVTLLSGPTRVWLGSMDNSYTTSTTSAKTNNYKAAGYRTLVYGKFRKNDSGQEFYFGATHLAINSNGTGSPYNLKECESHRYTANSLVKAAGGLFEKNLPVIIVGDMNTGPGGKNEGYPILTAYFLDAFDGANAAGVLSSEDKSYPSTSPGANDTRLPTGLTSASSRIDHILTKNLSILGYHNHRDRYPIGNGTYFPSDHTPISAILDL